MKSSDLDQLLESETNEQEFNVEDAIRELIDTNFSGSNEEQGKAAQLFKGLAFSDEPAANKFMKKLDELTSSLNVEDFVNGE